MLIRFGLVVLACILGTATSATACLAITSGLVSEWVACIGMTISCVGWAIGLTGVLNMWGDSR